MIENTVRKIYSLLLDARYMELEEFTGSSRLSADEIRECIDEYGCQLKSYPKKIELDVIEIEGSDPQEWSVVAPMYTSEEGLSDLSIELTLTDNGGTIFKSELDNIRVR